MRWKHESMGAEKERVNLSKQCVKNLKHSQELFSLS